jgi:hypothetical protein
MAEFVALVNEKQGSHMPNRIISELTVQTLKEGSHESIGIKNVGVFFRKLSKKCPKIMYQNVS